MRLWNVWVTRGGVRQAVGQVIADCEEWARCAARVRYGLTEQEAAVLSEPGDAILPDEDLEVSPV